MQPRHTSFIAGLAAMLPILPGVIPFAMIFGAAAASAGATWGQASGMSLAVFAGASQLAAVDLLSGGAPVFVAIFTALVINVRMTMYSAALAPHFSGLSAWRKAILSYFLTDQAFAVSISRFTGSGEAVRKPWYYLGGAVTLWLPWQAGTAAGAVLGARLPGSWSLDFAIPLTFIALAVPALRDRANGAAALCGGLAALAGSVLPFNLGLPLAVVAGVAAGRGFEIAGRAS